jgi:hypothetical protein
MDTNYPRSKKHSTTRQTVQAISWIPRPRSLQVDRKAADMHITRSRALRYLIEYALDDKTFDDNLKAILEVIREGNVIETRRNHKPYRDNSYRSAFLAAQCRSLIVNLLRFLVDRLGEPPEVTQRIYHQSEKEAIQYLTHLSPQIADIIRRRRALYLYTAAPRAWPSRLRAPSRGL